MSILSVRIYPDPVLRDISQRVGSFNEDLILLINDMKETMYSFGGCVGISAPQIGQNLEIIIVDVSKHKKTTVHHGRVVLVNPVILHSEGEVVTREGCLSVPGFTGNVRRATHIMIEGQDVTGEPVAIQTEGFEAIAFQHEIDHLNGVVFLDRIRSKKDIFKRKTFLK